MQGYEPGMTALIHHRHRSFFLQADLSQTILLAIVSFAKMGTQTALSFFNAQHRKPPGCWKEHVRDRGTGLPFHDIPILDPVLMVESISSQCRTCIPPRL